MSGRKRGFVLVACSLLLSVLMVLGVAVLSSRAAQYESAQLYGAYVEARALAFAGLEATRVKLLRDLNFPPSGSGSFDYSEDVLDFAGEVRGSYRIRVERDWLHHPYSLLRISSRGITRDGHGVMLIVAEMDLSPQSRDGSGSPNTDFFRWISWSESGVNWNAK